MNNTPISVNDAIEQAQSIIPDEVYMAINELLVQSLDTVSKRVIIIKQEKIVEKILELMGIHRDEFNFKWLNIESAYEAVGWKVEYNKPCWDETFEAYFEFDGKNVK